MLLTPPQRRILQWIALGLAVGLFVWLLRPVLAPFAVGAVLAYALHPLVEKLAATRVPRLLAVAVVEIAALIVAASLILLVVPILSKELPLLRDQLPLLVERVNATLSPWLHQMGINVVLDLDPVNDYAHFGIGLCRLKAGDHTAARGHLRQATVMRPDNEDYRVALARAEPDTL